MMRSREIRHLRESQPNLLRRPQHVPTYVPMSSALASWVRESESCIEDCGVVPPVDRHEPGNASAYAPACDTPPSVMSSIPASGSRPLETASAATAPSPEIVTCVASLPDTSRSEIDVSRSQRPAWTNAPSCRGFRGILALPV